MSTIQVTNTHMHDFRIFLLHLIILNVGVDRHISHVFIMYIPKYENQLMTTKNSRYSTKKKLNSFIDFHMFSERP